MAAAAAPRTFERTRSSVVSGSTPSSRARRRQRLQRRAWRASRPSSALPPTPSASRAIVARMPAQRRPSESSSYSLSSRRRARKSALSTAGRVRSSSSAISRYERPSSSRITITRDWMSESSSNAPQRWSRRSLATKRPVRRGAVDEPRVVGRAQAVLRVHRDLLGAARAAVVVDRLVAGDPVDPRLEGDLGVGLAQAAQRGEEGLLGHVLGAALVAHHAAHVRRDPRAVARVQLLEGGVVSAADRGDERRDPCSRYVWRSTLLPCLAP